MQCPYTSTVRERHNKVHGFCKYICGHPPILDVDDWTGVESANGFVWCHECRDFVYDPTFEEIRSGNSKKRKITPTAQEADQKLVSNNSAVTPCAATGLRGLYNMGQTCFMSVILQSLIHNPLIRTFYLSEGHKSGDCDREACTSCALDDIFTDFYGQEKHEGYGAVHMLQGCWKGGGGLAGYSQQDAHEYLGFILNSLHEANTAEDEENNSSKRESQQCDCIVHQTFGGLMRSTVTCSSCNNTTTASDPFMDLSLDIKSPGFITKKKKLGMINGVQTVKEALPIDLVECLDRFTSIETLPSDNYRCRKCATNREAKKKLSLTRLPPVIPIHLKRFSHSKTNSQSSKVDTRVRFPFTLSLAPYVTPDSDNAANGHVSNQADGGDEDTINVKTPTKAAKDAKATAKAKEGDVQEPVYELSSVIVHKGKLDNGHYISYSRQESEWFRFDDSMVIQVDEKEVLGAEAYMLFYVVSEI